jgi:type IV pilus assembly protein PilM
MPLAIEIRQGYINLVEASVSKNEILIKNLHHFKFDENWINDQGVVNVDEFASLLKTEIEKAHIKEKKVTICINNNSIIYREILLPEVDERKIPLLVRSEMMTNLNLTPDYIMDYITIDQITKNELTQYRLLGVALPKQYIESLINVCKSINLKVEVIDSAANAIVKYVKSCQVLKAKEQIIVTDVEDNYLRQYLFETDKYALTRNNRIDEITRKNKEEVINNIIDNINKMIQFTYTRNSTAKLSKILLTGDDENLSLIRRRVKSSLNVNCEVIHANPNVKGNHQNRYINAIGSLMRVSK